MKAITIFYRACENYRAIEQDQEGEFIILINLHRSLIDKLKIVIGSFLQRFLEMKIVCDRLFFLGSSKEKRRKEKRREKNVVSNVPYCSERAQLKMSISHFHGRSLIDARQFLKTITFLSHIKDLLP